MLQGNYGNCAEGKISGIFFHFHDARLCNVTAGHMPPQGGSIVQQIHTWV